MKHPHWMRGVVGLVLVFHGLGHAVYGMRGVGEAEGAALTRELVTATWTVALVAFVVAGFGLLGFRPWARIWRSSALAGVVASGAIATIARMSDLWWGITLDLVAVFAIVAFPDVLPDRIRKLRLIPETIGVLFVAWISATALTRPIYRHWGCDGACVARELPWDRLARDPAIETNRAITIAAPPERIWPWLVQIGQDRGGFYSHEWLEDLIGADIDNADRIHPEWQSLEAGGFVRAVPRGWPLGLVDRDLGWRVTALEPERGFVLEMWGQFVLVPREDGRTDLQIRTPMGDPHAPVWGAALTFATFDLPHAIMETGMLRGIKERAERREPVASR